jgi:pimeloyl-ACP methyl ester carboxylesterase
VTAAGPHVRVTGAGAPIVLLHGWAMDHRIFRPQQETLARHFKVVTFDRRGFGLAAGRPDLNRELDDLDTIAGELVGEPFHLLGLSQGGRIALRYAATRPDRLRSLILQGAAIDGAELEGPREERIPLDEFAELARDGRIDEVRRRWLRHPMMRLGDGHPEAERLLGDMLSDYSGADLTQGAQRPHQVWTDELRAVAAAALPVLILTGEREIESRRRAARLLLEMLPQAREVLLAGSGHLSNLTEPEAYNAAVIEFCRGVDGRPERSEAGAHD